MNVRRLSVPLATSVLLVAVLAACSPSDDGEMSDRTTTAESVTVDDPLGTTVRPTSSPRTIEVVDYSDPDISVDLSLTNVLVRAVSLESGGVVRTGHDAPSNYGTVDFEVLEVSYAGRVLSDTPELPIPEVGTIVSAVVDSELTIRDRDASNVVWVGLWLASDGYLGDVELPYLVTFIASEKATGAWTFDFNDSEVGDRFERAMAGLIDATEAESAAQAFEVYRQALADAIHSDDRAELGRLSAALQT